jgi:hypothetical protein
VNVWQYEPTKLAAEHAVLTREFPGRLLLGIGIGHPEATSDYTRPLSTMRKFLDGLDGADMPVAREERCMAALGPKMLDLNSLGAEIPVRWRLVLDPEQRVPDRELRDYLLKFVSATEPVHLDGAERSPVEIHCRPTVSNRQLRLDARLRYGAFVTDRRILASFAPGTSSANST